jgi:hypothetical protein
MLSIRLYKPEFIDQIIQFPESWDELTQSDLETIANAFFYNQVPPVVLLLQLLQNRINSDILPLLSVEDISTEYSMLTEFITSGINRTETVQCPEQTHYKLGKFLENVSVAQFEDADIFLRLFLQEKSDENLREFIRSLYGLTPEITDNNRLKWASSLFYMLGCKLGIKNAFPLLFNGDGNNNDAPDELAFTKLIHHAAGPRNGTRDQIRRLEVKEFLFDCQLQAEQAPDVY